MNSLVLLQLLILSNFCHRLNHVINRVPVLHQALKVLGRVEPPFLSGLHKLQVPFDSPSRFALVTAKIAEHELMHLPHVANKYLGSLVELST